MRQLTQAIRLVKFPEGSPEFRKFFGGTLDIQIEVGMIKYERRELIRPHFSIITLDFGLFSVPAPLFRTA